MQPEAKSLDANQPDSGRLRAEQAHSVHPETEVAKISMKQVFAAQRGAFERTEVATLADRKAHLEKLRRLVARNRIVFCNALSADFGNRARQETLLAEINGLIGHLRYVRRRLRSWMRPRRRATSIWYLPGGNKVVAQPVGVVGIMVPYNYPIHLAFMPAAAALAAGNRVMIKMPELTPNLSALTKHLVRENFPEDEIAIVEGHAPVAEAFAALPFDHLLFTGSTEVGRKVMRAAAENLTPVTLELGGKSPVVVDEGYPLQRAAERVAWGRLFNAGQTCVAPDYVLVPEGREQEFADHAIAAARRLYPETRGNPDYTSIVSDQHLARLHDIVGDALERGARVVSAEPLDPRRSDRRFPLTALLSPPEESRAMQEELFGPVLPVVGYRDLERAVARINRGPTPLAAYYFGNSRRSRGLVERNLRAGGMTLNDTLLHYLQDDLPFGGLGFSGMGAYHGREGFDTFSHYKAVFTQRGVGGFTGATLLYPPYGRLAALLLRLMRNL